jgi:tetratricopeptide (TPR) repeat protein
VGAVKDLTTEMLQVVSLIAVVAALLLLVLLVGAMVRTMLKALFGRATYVAPFTGCELAPAVSSILAQRLSEVERDWVQLSRDIKDEVDAFNGVDAMKTACGGVRADVYLNSQATQWVDAQPIDGQLLKPITAFGVTVSPETVFSLLYRVQNIVAPRAIHGTVHQLGATIRLSVRMSERRDGHRRDRHVPQLRPVAAAEQLLELVDDAAFDIVWRRVLVYGRAGPAQDPEANTWAGYRSFLDGYLHHLRFLRTGDPDEREAATRSYEKAIGAEADHHLAHYNLGLLLYARYTAIDNEKAIRHFSSATTCSSSRIRMLALSGLAMANGQQVHRYGCVGEPWVGRADHASRGALRLSELSKEPMEEVYFARGWSEQVRGNAREAVRWYGKATALPLRGDAVRQAEQRRMKSFAQTNAGYLAFTVLGAAEEAEALLWDALKHNPFNQMSHANLAELFRRRGEYEKALAEYDEALKLERSYFNAMNEMALVYVEMAQHERDTAGRATLLDKARDRHEHAVALVPADDEIDRIRLREAFDDALDADVPRSVLRRSVPFPLVWPGARRRNGHRR